MPSVACLYGSVTQFGDWQADFAHAKSKLAFQVIDRPQGFSGLTSGKVRRLPPGLFAGERFESYRSLLIASGDT